MGEIKFRAWDTTRKLMRDHACTLRSTGWSAMEIHEDSEEFVWMQYTGLKDKNGKEIYEGDILLGKFILDQVENYIFLSLTEEEKKTQTKKFVIEDIFYPYVHPIPDDLEIIGNVWENPELINDLK